MRQDPRGIYAYNLAPFDGSVPSYVVFGASTTTGQVSGLAGSNYNFVVDSLGKCRLALFDVPGSISYVIDPADGEGNDPGNVIFAPEGSTFSIPNQILRDVVCNIEAVTDWLTCTVSDKDPARPLDPRTTLLNFGDSLAIATPGVAASFPVAVYVMENVNTFPCPQTGTYAMFDGTAYAGIVAGSYGYVQLGIYNNPRTAMRFVFRRQANGLCRLNSDVLTAISPGAFVYKNVADNISPNAQDVYLLPRSGADTDPLYCAFDPATTTKELVCRAGFNLMNAAVDFVYLDVVDSISAVQQVNGPEAPRRLTMVPQT